MATKESKNQVIVDLTTLTDGQIEKVREIKKQGGQAEVTKCRFCGKILIRDKSIEQEAGDYCDHLREELGYTSETLMAHRNTMSATTVPEGWIKVADLHKICVRENIPVSRMVRAFGGDRTLKAPLHPKFQPIYVGNARWLDPWCASKEGLDFLRGIKQTKEQKIATELAELGNA